VKLPFSQGIVKRQTDANGVPTFLQKVGTYINLVVSPDPTVIAFSHKGNTYLAEERKSVNNAWGPFNGGPTAYLYWDLSLLDASLTRGTTFLPPVVSTTEPVLPSPDQHWFDLVSKTMYVWNGKKWIEKVRVFAATLVNQTTLQVRNPGSQADINVETSAGSIVLDEFLKPIKTSSGKFLTTATEFSTVTSSISKATIEGVLVQHQCVEPIPKFSLVRSLPGKKIALARNTDTTTRISGIITTDLEDGEIGNVTTSGIVQNALWNWDESRINKPVFCGSTGEVTSTPPTSGVLQIVGYIYDSTSIFLNIQQPVILTAPASAPIIVGTPPVASFTIQNANGILPHTVSFTSTSTNASSYFWDFGDGNSSTLENPSHTYMSAGTYTIRLRASNDVGFDDSIKVSSVTILPASDPGITANLQAQISGPLQIGFGKTFEIALVTSNSGLQTASNISRSIIVSDLAGQPISISSMPAGSTVVVGNGRTVINIPIIPSLATNQAIATRITLIAPSTSGNITVVGAVSSPTAESTVSNNSSTLTVRVKP